MTEPILVAKNEREICLLPQMANRHGLIAGATGTGKTVTLRTLAEGFSRRGVPVFVADVKGDLGGLSLPAGDQPPLGQRAKEMGLADWQPEGSPVTYWDVWGEAGHPVRATISDMGPLLLGRLLQLNEIQEGVLSLVFRVADDQGLLILDLKDLRSMVQYVGNNASEFATGYGRVSTASIGSIQRALLALEEQGAEQLFGEPALDLDDLMQTDRGRGVINLLAAEKMMASPRLYSTFLLWLLSELFERLPEVGDVEKPKLAFFFDEAHLLFNEAPPALLEKVEQVVRLIRSKGIGVYFISQNPLDIPDNVLGQMGNRVQHALRAFTPRDQKAVRAAAETFRSNPGLNVESVITELAVGEALVSMLDDAGRPEPVERARIVPPRGQLGPISPEKRAELIRASVLYGHYEKTVERESAYELLKERADAAARSAQAEAAVQEAGNRPAGPARRGDTLWEGVAKSTMRAAGTQIGRELVRGLLGTFLGGMGGGTRRRR